MSNIAPSVADTSVFRGGRLVPMADHPDPVAERIAQVMELRGWTAAELARRAGLQTPTHISTILKRGGERTSGTVLAKIAAAAGVRDRWLITGEGRRDFDATDTLADPRMRNRDGFAGALAGARTLRPQYGDYVWEAVAQSDPMVIVPLTPALLADLADVLVKYLAPR